MSVERCILAVLLKLTIGKGEEMELRRELQRLNPGLLASQPVSPPRLVMLVMISLRT